MLKKWTCFFNIFVGASILMMWGFFFITNNIPELETEPYAILLHLVAEGLTGLMLIFSSLLIIKKSAHQKTVYYISYGMLLYTLINSSGYFLESTDYYMLILFTVLFIGATTILILNIKNKRLNV